MRSKIRVSLLDDETELAKRWKSDLESLRLGTRPANTRFTFSIFNVHEDLEHCIEGLSLRREFGGTCIEDDSKFDAAQKGALKKLDETEVFVIDYDLLNAKNIVSYTGEDVAYLARCYSTCKAIVAVNQFTTAKDFDLSLTGRPESFADLNVSEPHITNVGLWSSSWPPGFRPWSWPVLPDLVDKFDQRVKFVRDRLDLPMLRALGFEASEIETLPRSAIAFLSRSATNVERLTFRDFVQKSANTLRPKDVSRIGSGATADDKIARIAAARLSRWLEDFILPAQEILVDAPHLVSRYPSLLTGSRQRDPRTWNKTAHIASARDLGIDHELLNQFAFPEFWLSRPAWFWPRITTCRRIAEVADPTTRKASEFVFCEDVSAFVPKHDGKSFTAAVPSTYVRRYVAGTQATSLFPGVGNVEYHPAVRFSL